MFSCFGGFPPFSCVDDSSITLGIVGIPLFSCFRLFLCGQVQYMLYLQKLFLYLQGCELLYKCFSHRYRGGIYKW